MDGQIILAVCCFLGNIIVLIGGMGVRNPGDPELPVLLFSNEPHPSKSAWGDELTVGDRELESPSALSHHHVTRRQACTPGSEEMQRQLALIDCDPSYVEAAVDFLSETATCGLDLRESEFNRCGTNHNGEVCAEHDPFIREGRDMSAVASDIERLCFLNLPETFENCSSECRSVLEEFSDRFGCCIHTEPSLRDDGSGMIFAPVVWSRCGVIQPAPCDDTPLFPQAASTDDTCSFLCLIIQSIALECRYLASQRLQLYEDCGDVESALDVRQTCGFNENGEHCGGGSFGVFQDESDRRDFAFSVYNKCYSYYTTNLCSTQCREALQEMSDSLGCCVNNMNSTNIFNRDGIEVQITRYDLWSTCGVQTPGFCNLPTDPSMYDRLLECNTCADNII